MSRKKTNSVKNLYVAPEPGYGEAPPGFRLALPLLPPSSYHTTEINIFDFDKAYMKSDLFRDLVSVFEHKTTKFIEYTNAVQEEGVAVQSISANNHILNYILQINKMGFFTVDSGEGICYTDGVTYEIVKRSYIMGYMTRALLKHFIEAFLTWDMEDDYKLYFIPVSFRPYTKKKPKELAVLDREYIIRDNGNVKLGLQTAFPLREYMDFEGALSELSDTGHVMNVDRDYYDRQLHQMLLDLCSQTQLWHVVIVRDTMCVPEGGYDIFSSTYKALRMASGGLF
jgi:hypothetical protein